MENQEVKRYPPDSAGHAMVADIPVVRSGETVAEVKSYVIRETHRFLTVNYIYVVDTEKRLRGTVSIRELFSADVGKKISDVISRDPIFLHPYSDQERAVVLAIRHNIKAIPVVDHEKKLLGVIAADRILGILHEEHAEDILHAAGVQKSLEEVASFGKESSFVLLWRRIPWLIVGLGAGIFAAYIIRSFEHTLEQALILAAFIPAIVYLSDAVGNQTQVLLIRSLTFQELFRFQTYVWREVRVGVMMAGSLAIAMAILGGIASRSHIVAAILGTTLLFSILIAMTVAIFIPYVLIRLKQDPALASGPFSTAIRDIVSLLIYFSVASILLELFG